MKRTILMTMMVAIIMAFSSNANADNDKKDRKREFNAEQMVQHRAEVMASKMQLDDVTTSKFIATYKEYLKEMHGVFAQYGQQKRGKKNERKSDVEVEQEIKSQFAMSRAIIDVREKYYSIFREFLNPQQIKTIYSQEREQNNRMKWEKGRRNQDDMHGMKEGKGPRGMKNGHRPESKPEEAKK